MKILFSIITLSLTLSLWGADDQNRLLTHDLMQGHELADRVLSNKYIYVAADDRVTVAFDRARGMLDRPDLLNVIQEGYASVLEPGEEVEFEIHEIGDGHYRYQNRKDQTTDIHELHRDWLDKNTFEVIFYSSGKRFFGHFSALTHLQVKQTEEGDSKYLVDVFVYPRNGFSRFFARHLNLVEKFFNSKTDEIRDIAVRVTQNVCGENTRTARREAVSPDTI